MSDASGGPDWWVASDGKWYPPESHPDRLAPPSAPQPALPTRPATLTPPPGFPTGSTAGPFGSAKKPWWKRWWLLALVVVIGLAVLGAAIGSQDDTDAPTPSTVAVGTVTAGDTSPAATAAPQADPRGTREQPFAIGEPVTFTVDALGDGDGSVWTLTVEAGSDITSEVLAENQFNEAPPTGSVFYGVPVTLRLDAANKEPLSTLFNIELELFGATTLEIIDAGLDEGCGVVPDGFDVFKEVFVGGSITGVVCLQVTQPDVDAGVLLTLDSNEGDRIFVATRSDQADLPPAAGATATSAPPSQAIDEADLARPGSRRVPYSIGEPIEFRVDGLGEGDGSEWTLTVDGPGADLTDAVLAENQFNEAPADGSLYFAVPVTLTLRSANKEPLSTLFNIELEFYGPATLEIIDEGLDEGCGVVPDEFDPLTEVFVGGSVSGNVCLEVTEADVEAGVMLTLDSNEGDRIFVATR